MNQGNETYDTAEAEALLRRRLGSTAEPKALEVAAKDLLDEVAKVMDGLLSVQWTQQGTQEILQVALRNPRAVSDSVQAVKVLWSGEAFAFLEVLGFAKQGRSSSIRLSYHVAAGRFETEEDDTFHVPIPGAPRRKRDASAAVVERIVAVLLGVAQDVTAQPPQA